MKQFIICPNCGAIELHESKVDFEGVFCACYKCHKKAFQEVAKAISIKQPWAYLICSGIKDIENRTWRTNFRGRVLIHAGANDAFHPDCAYDVLGQDCWSYLTRETQLKIESGELQKSAIIGSVEIVDCVINHLSIWAEKTEVINDPDPELSFLPAYGKKIYNWVLKDPIIFEKPILNVKGKLSFFIPEIL